MHDAYAANTTFFAIADKGRNIKEYFTLSEDDRNMLVFLDKNRWGEDKNKADIIIKSHL